MASIEVFCSNVKTVLAQRGIRIKDLAERIGLSESYLSLVLSGSRKNLNDEYKDRIASFLNVSLSDLYSEEFGAPTRDAAPIFVEDPDRRETVRLVDTFLSSTHLDSARPSFHSVLARLNDRDAQTVRYFLSSVLSELAKQGGTSGKLCSSVESMSEEGRRLLVMYSLAGPSAKLEWVRIAANLDQDSFNKITAGLVSAGMIQVTEDLDTHRASLVEGDIPVSSIYTSQKLREIHLSLAFAMLTYPDDGPYFETAVAEHFTRGGRPKEAREHATKAARLMEATGLWREAAGEWHQAAVLSGILDDVVGRSNCLAEAAKCLCAAGDFREANEYGNHACSLIQERIKDPRPVGYVCIMMGNMLHGKNLDLAIEWYRKGIKSSPPEDPGYGILLSNLASTLIDANKLDEAENALKQVLRWSAGRDPKEAGSISAKVSNNLGTIEFQRRNWKQARSHFESCLEQSSGTENLGPVWHNLGILVYRDDNVKLAREYLTNAQELYLQKDNKVKWAWAAMDQAKVALRSGDLDSASRHLRSAEPLLDDNSPVVKGWVLLVWSCLESLDHRQSQAIESGRKAVDIFQREGAERDLAVAALWLSSVYKETGDAQQAAFMERRAFQIYEKNHWDIRELHRERSLLEPKTA